jgi:archaellum component FlaC
LSIEPFPLPSAALSPVRQSPIEAVHERLARFARRERSLLLARALLQVLGVTFLSLLLATALVAARAPRSLALPLFVVLGGLALLAALSLPLARAWGETSRASRQARCVESLRPELRGRLLVVAERANGAREGESETILLWIAERCRTIVEALSPQEIHDTRLLRRLGLAAALLGMLLGAAHRFAPVTPLASLRILFHPEAALVASDLPALRPDAPRAVVGDVVLRYIYPAYTRLEAMDVPNSTGDVHAPLGTIVELRARTARPVDAAVLRVEATRAGDAAEGEGGLTEDLPVELRDARDLSTSFLVMRPGTWRFLLSREGAAEESVPRAIIVEPDLPPEVLVEAPGSLLEVSYDQPLPVTWSVRDDYGNVRVEALARRQQVALEPRVLRSPVDTPTRMDGDLSRVTPADLGLRPGDEALLIVRAWDNDAILGSKEGRSRSLRLVVHGPQGQAARTLRRVRELRDVLVPVLADFLEEDFPPGRTHRDLLAWTSLLQKRFASLDELVERLWEGLDPESFEGTVLETIQRSREALQSFASVLSVPRGPAGGNEEIAREDLQNLGLLRDDTIARVEQGLLTLDEIVRTVAMMRVSELVRSVAEQAREIASRRDATAEELSTRLDRLERELERLRKAAADMSEGNLREFVNSRAGEAQDLVEKVRRALAEGRIEEAKALLERLARELQEFAEALEDMQAAAEAQSGKAGEDAARLQAELEQLEKAELALAEETAELARRFGVDLSESARQWAELLALAESLADGLSGLDGLMGEDPARSAGERGWIRRASENGRSLSEALRARDPQRGLQQARETGRAIDRLAEVVAWMDAIREAQKALGPESRDVKEAIGVSKEQAQTLRRELERLARAQSRVSPEMQTAARELGGRQEALRKRTEGAAREAGRLARDFAMRAPGLEEGVRKAEASMGLAGEHLAEGRAGDGELAERAAAAHLAEARAALQKAQRDQEQMRQLMRGEGGGEARREPGGQKKSGSGNELRGERVEIPVPEEFRTPEAYRRALLDGMAGPVPREYEAMKRRYYEELVKQ